MSIDKVSFIELVYLYHQGYIKEGSYYSDGEELQVVVTFELGDVIIEEFGGEDYSDYLAENTAIVDKDIVFTIPDSKLIDEEDRKNIDRWIKE